MQRTPCGRVRPSAVLRQLEVWTEYEPGSRGSDGVSLLFTLLGLQNKPSLM